MKFVQLNGVNVHELAFVVVPEMDVLHTCFNFWTIYQVSGLQKVLVTNIIVTF